MKITTRQKDLLRLLVSQDEVQGGAEFIVTSSFAGTGLIYPGGVSVPVTHGGTDFRQLKRENLITLTRISRNRHRGKPTELGVKIVRRGFAVSETNPTNRVPQEELPSELPEHIRLKMRAWLLRIHDQKERDRKDTKTYIRKAYGVFALECLRGGMALTESLLTEKIPGWVFQWAVAKRWWPYPPRRVRPELRVVSGHDHRNMVDFVPDKFKSSHEAVPENELTVLFGVYRVRERDKSEIMNILQSPIAQWRAEAAERAESAPDELKRTDAQNGQEPQPSNVVTAGAPRETWKGTTPIVNQGNASKPMRLPATITSPIAARRMETHLTNGTGQTEFATKVGTTDRTLRSFRKTGKIRRDLFDAIAREMGMTRDELLKPE